MLITLAVGAAICQSVSEVKLTDLAPLGAVTYRFNILNLINNLESVACYGCEVWLLKTEEQRKLLALEMDYLRRSARVSRLQKIPNTAIRNKMQAEQSI